MSSLKIVAIVIPIAVISVVLFFIAYSFLRRRPKKKHFTSSEENGEEKKINFFDHEIINFILFS
jgi:flagellar biosynthesis/type III secretory pathway M-ring protein FliF/YscJ